MGEYNNYTLAQGPGKLHEQLLVSLDNFYSALQNEDFYCSVGSFPVLIGILSGSDTHV